MTGSELREIKPQSMVSAMKCAAVFRLWVVLRCTRFGLRPPACGEHPFAARSVGTNPSNLRLVALTAGGVLYAGRGAEFATGSLRVFAPNMTAGRGFMAFAALIFGAGHPVWSTFAELFFAIAGVLGVRVQLTLGDNIPHVLLQTLPYLATILGVWISGKLRGGAKAATLTEEESRV